MSYLKVIAETYSASALTEIADEADRNVTAIQNVIKHVGPNRTPTELERDALNTYRTLARACRRVIAMQEE